MTWTLGQRLAGLAEEAVDYADAGAAVAAARRTRRTIAARVAVLVLLSGVGMVVVLRGLDRVAPAAPPPLPVPAVIAPPVATAPLLPSDRAAGRAAAVYRACAKTCPAYLVMTDGGQYRLNVPAPAPCCYQDSLQDLMAGLSPDGRWLAVTDGKGGTNIRDLLGTTVRHVAVDFVVSWSPNGLYARSNIYRVDVRTGALRPIPAEPEGTYPTGVGDDGRILLSVDDADPSRLKVASVWPSSRTTIDVGGLLRTDEVVSARFSQDNVGQAWQEFTFGPRQRTAVTVFSTHFHYSSQSGFRSARVAVLLNDGAGAPLSLRVDLPPHAGYVFFYGSHPVFATQASPQAPIKVSEIADDGTILSLTNFPATAEYAMAGTGFPIPGPAYPDGIFPGS